MRPLLIFAALLALLSLPAVAHADTIVVNSGFSFDDPDETGGSGPCETEEGRIDRIEREIELEGPLDEKQHRRLLEIADMCPVHRTLTSEVLVQNALAV